ncbi:hypothetical protein ACIOWI_36245, partial [Streptomyces sp. NPDC087659]|uniref:hypothetical protein n=1 Tax=Streptomyces sp. NPDC087659 TaxID=3365801 RepID=UPI0038002DFA
MSVVVPSWANDLMLLVVGEEFLQADEDLAYASAGPFAVLAAELLRVADEVERSAVQTAQSLPEDVGREYLCLATELVAVLREWARELEEVAEGRAGTTLDIVESKGEMFAELAWLAFCLGVLAAVAFFSAGGSAAAGRLLIARSRLKLLVIGDWLVRRTRLAPVVSEAVQEAFQVLMVRLGLIVSGWKGLHRKGLDGKAIGTAALIGALAAFGQQIFSGAGGQLKKTLGLTTTKPAFKPSLSNGSVVDHFLTRPRPQVGGGKRAPAGTAGTGDIAGSAGGGFRLGKGEGRSLPFTLVLGAGAGASLFLSSAISETGAEAFVQVTVYGQESGWNWTSFLSTGASAIAGATASAFAVQAGTLAAAAHLNKTHPTTPTNGSSHSGGTGSSDKPGTAGQSTHAGTGAGPGAGWDTGTGAGTPATTTNTGVDVGGGMAGAKPLGAGAGQALPALNTTPVSATTSGTPGIGGPGAVGTSAGGAASGSAVSTESAVLARDAGSAGAGPLGLPAPSGNGTSSAAVGTAPDPGIGEAAPHTYAAADTTSTPTEVSTSTSASAGPGGSGPVAVDGVPTADAESVVAPGAAATTAGSGGGAVDAGVSTGSGASGTSVSGPSDADPGMTAPGGGVAGSPATATPAAPGRTSSTPASAAAAGTASTSGAARGRSTALSASAAIAGVPPETVSGQAVSTPAGIGTAGPGSAVGMSGGGSARPVVGAGLVVGERNEGILSDLLPLVKADVRRLDPDRKITLEVLRGAYRELNAGGKLHGREPAPQLAYRIASHLVAPGRPARSAGGTPVVFSAGTTTDQASLDGGVFTSPADAAAARAKDREARVSSVAAAITPPAGPVPVEQAVGGTVESSSVKAGDGPGAPVVHRPTGPTSQTKALTGQAADELVPEVRAALQKLNAGHLADGVTTASVIEVHRRLAGDKGLPGRNPRIRVANVIAGFLANKEQLLGLHGGVKKKKKDAARPSSSSGGATVPSSRQDLPAGSSLPPTAPASVEYDIPDSTQRELNRLVEKLAARKRIDDLLRRMLTKYPYPPDQSLGDLVNISKWMLEQTDQLQSTLLENPHVVYAAIRQPALRMLLRWQPEKVATLGEALNLLESLVEHSFWSKFLNKEQAALLLREDIVRELEADPQMRLYVVMFPGLLEACAGRLDLLRIISKGKSPIQGMAALCPKEIGEALLALDDPAEVLHELGNDVAISFPLHSHINRSYILRRTPSGEYWRMILGDKQLRDTLRSSPEQIRISLASDQALRAVKENPEVLDILSKSSRLTDVLECSPQVAQRLLSNVRLIAAAINNQNVAYALSCDPQMYDNVTDDDHLEVLLNAAEFPRNLVPLAKDVSPLQASSGPKVNANAIAAASGDALKDLAGKSPAFHYIFTSENAADVNRIERLRKSEHADLVRRLSCHPEIVELPHQMRRILDLPENLLLPGDDFTSLRILMHAARHFEVSGLFIPNSPEEAKRQEFIGLLAEVADFREGLYCSPTLAYLSSTDSRPIRNVPAQILARNSRLAGTLSRNLMVTQLIADSPLNVKDLWLRALEAEDSALSRILYRHQSVAEYLTAEEWEPILAKVIEDPRPLAGLIHALGRMDSAYWEQLLSGKLYGQLARRHGQPMATALLRFPQVLREALARPAFNEAWEIQRELFDGLATQALEADSPDADAASIDAAVSRLRETVERTGKTVITAEGFALAPELITPVSVLVAGLASGTAPEAVFEDLRAAGHSPSEAVQDSYRRVRDHTWLQASAAKNRYLAQGLFYTPWMLNLLMIRPSLLDQFDRSPEMLRQTMSVPGLPKLLTRNDEACTLFTKRAISFDRVEVAAYLRNPDYLTATIAAFQKGFWISTKTVVDLVQQSGAVARGIAVLGNAAHSALAKSPLLVAKLRGVGEEVAGAVMATQGRLVASAQDPGLVDVVESLPEEVAKVLANRCDVASSAAGWAGLLKDRALVAELSAHPGLA